MFIKVQKKSGETENQQGDFPSRLLKAKNKLFQTKFSQDIFQRGMTVFCCVCIIVFGITLLSKADPITTSIGQDISTNNLSLSGSVTSGTWAGSSIDVAHGGTGQNWSTATQGSLPFFSGTGALSTLTPGTAGQFLQSGGVGANPSWADIPSNSATNVTRAATFVIAAPDSSALSKQQADYVCDGTDDQVEILSALAALPTTGGKIVLLSGTYNVESLEFSTSNLILDGGNGATLKLKNARHSNLSSAVNANDTTVAVIDGSQFRVGDRIIVRSDSAVEARTVMNINANTLTLESALTYSHPSTGEVWTRNNLLRVYSANNVKLTGIIFDGNFTKQVAGLKSGLFPAAVTQLSAYGGAYYEIPLIKFDAMTDFYIYGNKLLYSDGHGIWGYNSQRVYIRDNYIYNMRDKGIMIGADSGDGTINRIYIENNTMINMGATANMSGASGTYGDAIQFHTASDVHITNNYIEQWRRNGINIVGTRLFVEGNTLLSDAAWTLADFSCISLGTLSNHVIVDNNQAVISTGRNQRFLITSGTSTNVDINHNSVEGGGNATDATYGAAAILGGVTNFNFSDNTFINSHGAKATIRALTITNGIFSNNIIANPLTAGTAGLVIGAWTDVTFSGNQIYDSQTPQKMGYAISRSGTQSNVLLTNNILKSGTSGTIDSLTNLTIKSNPSYLTENSGTSTITTGLTSVTVTHGLATTPTRVQLTPTTSTGNKDYWISAKTATTFTITIDSTHTSDITFDWRGVVGEGN